MTILRPTIGALIGVLALGGMAVAQQDINELPEGVRQLLRTSNDLERQARSESGEVINQEADKQFRPAWRAARKAVEDYWTARLTYERVLGETTIARQEAAEADSHLINVRKQAVPNPPQQEAAQTDRDAKFRKLAIAEADLEVARQQLDSTRNPGGVLPQPAMPATGTDRSSTPPALPAPDFGNRQPEFANRPNDFGNRQPDLANRQPGFVNQQPGSAAWTTIPEGARRFAYHNAQDSFHLLGAMGTASFSRGGQPQLMALDFVKEREHFLFYRPRSGESLIVEWAFAKYPEFPAGGGDAKYAVWWRDRDGWHWEWTHRDAPVEILLPGPVPATSAAESQSTGLLAGVRAAAN